MTITTEFLNITGNRTIGHNPLPTFYNQCEQKNFFRVLPYAVLDRYNKKPEQIQLSVITMENDYLKAQFLPKNGGRLYSLYNKEEKQELLLRNSSLHPVNMSSRNAYFTGGASWNLTPDEHSPSSFEPVFFGKVEAGAGYEFLRMYDYERTRGLLWQIDFHLPANSKELYAHVAIHNPHDFPTPIYWWANLNIQNSEDCRLFSSGHSSTFDTAKDEASYPHRFKEKFSFLFSQEPKESHPWIVLTTSSSSGTFLRSSTKIHTQKAIYANDSFVELQAGSNADMTDGWVLDANESLSFTHAIGSITFEEGDADYESYNISHSIVKGMVNYTLPAGKLEQQELYFQQFTSLPCSKMLSFGEGWGALENMRRIFDNQPLLSESLVFPTESFTNQQYEWLAILNKTELPDLTGYQLPKAWVSDMNYLTHIQSYLATFPNNVMALLFLGTIFYENHFTDQAIEAWKLALEREPLTILLRNLSHAAHAMGFTSEALSYMEQIKWQSQLNIDQTYLEEYFALLLEDEQYQKMLDHYNRLPAKLQQYDTIHAQALTALTALDKVEPFE